MRRTCWSLAFALALIPSASHALQLHWTSGATNLTLTGATRCTLIVQADPQERMLPSEWRLLWVADSSGVQFAAVDSLEACLLEQAQVSRIEGPVTPADSAAHLVTERFCSVASSPATAQQVLDLPAGGHGRLKAIALDPTDPNSSRVIESNEVTYNGGVAGSYRPAVLHASSVHQSLQLRVTAVGAGLSTASSMSILALDSSWTLPLSVTAQSEGSLTGVASVAALLPECQATVGSATGAVSAATLPADETRRPRAHKAVSRSSTRGCSGPRRPCTGSRFSRRTSHSHVASSMSPATSSRCTSSTSGTTTGTTRRRPRLSIRNSTRRTSATSGPPTSTPGTGPVG